MAIAYTVLFYILVSNANLIKTEVYLFNVGLELFQKLLKKFPELIKCLLEAKDIMHAISYKTIKNRQLRRKHERNTYLKH